LERQYYVSYRTEHPAPGSDTVAWSQDNSTSVLYIRTNKGTLLKLLMITDLSSAAFVLALVLLVLPNLLKPTLTRIRIQELASQALNREVLLDGPLDTGLFRGPHVILYKVHIKHDEYRW